MKEIWKAIEGFADYEVSNLGQVRSYATNGKVKILKPRKVSASKPYPMVYLKNNGDVFKLVRIHRLVAKAFVSSPVGKGIVNHIDGNKQNNIAKNLEWANNHGNNLHAHETGLRNGPSLKRRRVMKMISPNVYEIYPSLAEAARQNSVSDTSIRRVCNGIGQTAGGFEWKFVD